MRLMKILMASMLITAMMSATAFAMVGQPNYDDGNVTTLAETQKKETPSKLYSGEVEDVTKKDDLYTIRTKDIVYHEKAGDVLVIEQKTGKMLRLEDIKKGMKITAVVDKMAPMTLSLPGQTSGALAFVVSAEAEEVSSIDLSIYNSELTNMENTLKLNVSDKTQIVNINGEKKVFTSEDIKSKECLVLYTITTRSIPAQTNPEMVVIIGEGEIPKVEDNEKVVGQEEKAKGYVPLRSGAEAKGFKVEWAGAKRPLILTKDDMTVTINIGSDELIFTHSTKDIKPLDNMKKLSMVVTFENGTTMVPTDFVEAL